MRYLLTGLLMITTLFDWAHGERTLSSKEVESIFHTVTAVPRDTWIPSGVIQARHTQYRAPLSRTEEEIEEAIQLEVDNYLSNPNKPEATLTLQTQRLRAIPQAVRHKLTNEYAMVTDELVKYDGRRFYWSIDVVTREDSIKSRPNPYNTSQFDLEKNMENIFIWDGDRYTRYFKSANYAMINDDPSTVPIQVHGPLKAGLIPWGYGIYTLNELLRSDVSAVELQNDRGREIHLDIGFPNGIKLNLVLDPQKDYAVQAYTLWLLNDHVIIQTNDRFRKVDGAWIPTLISIEEYENAPQQFLLRSEAWEYTSIQSGPLDVSEFSPPFESDALIERRLAQTDRSQKYLYTNPEKNNIDSQTLCNARLNVLTSDLQKNCATVAFSYVAGQYNREVSSLDLSSLIDPATSATSLYDLKTYLESLGLYCEAIRTSVEGLSRFSRYQCILHLPGEKHYVVLGNIDNRYIRLIDLSKDNFFYRVEKRRFHNDWSEGVALIVADEPIEGVNPNSVISDLDMQKIQGQSTCEFGCYTCTDLIQEFAIQYCYSVAGMCEGESVEWVTRWGCESAANGEGGYCRGTEMFSWNSTPCIPDTKNPGGCTVTGVWTGGFIRACN